MSIKEKIEGNELDLSLNQLTEVPVKELASATKATHLDLSCNRIQSLPNDFVSLTHLVKIDLSRNQLIELPYNFGHLVNLQYLDLYQNQLKNVPVSFCRLKNLRWLDLKKNPLQQKLKAIAGDCLDEKQCQSCAKKVVGYMQSVESDMERIKQKNLKEMREKEAVQRAKIEKELEEQRKQKKLEKEKRKAESRARREEKSIENKLEQNTENSGDKHDAEDKECRIAQNGGMNWLVFFFISIVLVAAAVLYSFYLEAETVANVQVLVQEFIMKWSKRLATDSKFIIPYIVDMKSNILRAVHYTMLSVSNLASNIELFLSIYF